MDYYRALSHNSVAVANDEAEPEVKDAESFKEIPKLFERLMKILFSKAPQQKDHHLSLSLLRGSFLGEDVTYSRLIAAEPSGC